MKYFIFQTPSIVTRQTGTPARKRAIDPHRRCTYCEEHAKACLSSGSSIYVDACKRGAYRYASIVGTLHS